MREVKAPAGFIPGKGAPCDQYIGDWAGAELFWTCAEEICVCLFHGNFGVRFSCRKPSILSNDEETISLPLSFKVSCYVTNLAAFMR